MWREYEGSVQDWQTQTQRMREIAAANAPAAAKPPAAAPQTTPAPSTTRRKLNYKEQRELAGLPARIERLEAEQARLHADANGPAFYRKPSEIIATTLARVQAVDQELLEVLARWDDLDSRQKRS